MRSLSCLMCLLPLLASCREPRPPTPALDAPRALAPAPPPLKGDIASVLPSVPGLDALKAEKAAKRAAGELPPGHAGAGAPSAAAAQADHPPPPAEPPVEVAPVAPADHSIAEVRAQKKVLVGKEFEVRARVTKVNLNIMGKTWLHLRDGSEPGDLTVTTTGSAAVGDLVTVRGKLSIDRGIGAGYNFEIIMEDAVVQIEEPALTAPTPPAGQP